MPIEKLEAWCESDCHLHFKSHQPAGLVAFEVSGEGCGMQSGRFRATHTFQAVMWDPASKGTPIGISESIFNVSASMKYSLSCEVVMAK